jgi:predicted outer membrane protein
MELDKLAVLAHMDGVDPIREPIMPAQWTLLRSLLMYSGQDFDRFYARTMVQEHRTDVQEHRTDVHHYEMSVKEQDEKIASHAEETLPILREHLMMIEEIAGKVGADLSGT